LVLGKVATQWQSQGGTPAALTSLFADQKRNIADAIPSGLALNEIPGADAVRSAAQSTRRTVESAGRRAPSLASWLLPLAVLLVAGFLLWNFLRPRPAPAPAVTQNTATEGERVTAMKPVVPDAPAVPNISQLSGDLTGMFKTMSETFAGIKDAASAEEAAPKLEELSAKLDTMKKAASGLPETGRATLQRIVDQQLNPIAEQAKQKLTLPGLSDRIKALIDQIVRKLEEWRLISQAR
jgi:hypothetical protein